MNESENKMVSDKGLHKFLEQLSFEEFFIYVNKLMLELPANKLNFLSSVVKSFDSKYSSEALTYLNDTIHKEFILYGKGERNYNKKNHTGRNINELL